MKGRKMAENNKKYVELLWHQKYEKQTIKVQFWLERRKKLEVIKT